jgi:uncharacterized membrane protein YkvA (DUF1232 family)
MAELIIVMTVAYALSPIDLIPDFIPVLGYLDDLLILPAGIWLAIRLTPDVVWAACKAQAAVETSRLPKNRRAAIVVVLLWVLLCIWLAGWIYGRVT